MRVVSTLFLSLLFVGLCLSHRGRGKYRGEPSAIRQAKRTCTAEGQCAPRKEMFRILGEQSQTCKDALRVCRSSRKSMVDCSSSDLESCTADLLAWFQKCKACMGSKLAGE